MGEGQRGREWLTQIGVCVGYALGFCAIHAANTTAAHWHVYAGFQLICLLLVPYRYWAAMCLGEAVPNACFAWQCLPDFNATWVAVRMIPEILLCMPIVWFYRERLAVFPTKYLVNVKALLGCLFMAAVVISAYNFVLISTLGITSGPYRPRPLIAGIYLAGNYAGLLTIVPCALIARLDYRKIRVKAQIGRLRFSRLLADALGLAIPVIVLIAMMTNYVSNDPTQLLETTMLIPAAVAWLALKHGWRAVALSGTVVIICNGILQPGTPTPGPAEMTIVICLAVSALYTLGAKVSAQRLRDERERIAAQEVHDMARQHLMDTERRMRRAAERLEFVAGALHIANSQTLQHMRRILPNIETHAFYKQAVKAHEQVYMLAESLHPSAWRDRGLPAALNETLARALDEAGLSYRCEISGRGFMFLESAVHTAIYRTACESIVYVTSDITCSSVKLIVRAGETNHRRWVVVRVEGHLDKNGVAKSVYFGEPRRELALKLGTSLSDVQGMRAHARTFDGVLHVRASVGRVAVTTLLHSQSVGVQKQKDSQPLRLWVD
jgi:hypothetical protein